MWDQYRKTLGGIQVVILAVTVAIYLSTRFVVVAGVFFVAMQIGGVVGAMWGYRLRRKIEAAPINASLGQSRRR